MGEGAKIELPVRLNFLIIVRRAVLLHIVEIIKKNKTITCYDFQRNHNNSVLYKDEESSHGGSNLNYHDEGGLVTYCWKQFKK